MYFSVRRTRSRPRRFGRLRLARSNDSGSAFSQWLAQTQGDPSAIEALHKLGYPLFKRRFHP